MGKYNENLREARARRGLENSEMNHRDATLHERGQVQGEYDGLARETRIRYSLMGNLSF